MCLLSLHNTEFRSSWDEYLCVDVSCFFVTDFLLPWLPSQDHYPAILSEWSWSLICVLVISVPSLYYLLKRLEIHIRALIHLAFPFEINVKIPRFLQQISPIILYHLSIIFLQGLNVSLWYSRLSNSEFIEPVLSFHKHPHGISLTTLKDMLCSRLFWCYTSMICFYQIVPDTIDITYHEGSQTKGKSSEQQGNSLLRDAFEQIRNSWRSKSLLTASFPSARDDI